MGDASLDNANEWGKRALNSLLDLLYPRRCAGCGQPGEVWCLTCDRQLIKFSERVCQRCFRALPGSGVYCRACSRELGEPLIASFSAYRGPLKRALLSLKYRPDKALADVMASWLADRWGSSGWQASLIIPVPLAAARMRQRGFNQAALLAHGLASQLGLTCLPEALRRGRNTNSQVGLDHDERWQNVRGAFQANHELIRDQAVLLVDDLYTTGATMKACRQALREARRVFGLTVARA